MSTPRGQSAAGTLQQFVSTLVTNGLATLREENRRLRSLVNFGRQVTAERDPRAQLRLLCAELRRTTKCSAAAVILLDPERGAVETIESSGLPLGVDTLWQQAVRAAPR
jgi:DNA-binding IclR family transcriptional regulator